MNEPHPYPQLYADGQNAKGLYIGSSIWRSQEVENVSSMGRFYNIAMNLKIQFWDCPVMNDALIQRSRSRAASEFLQSGCQVFVMIDSDIAFRPEDLLRIAEETYRWDIVGGAYVKRMSGTKAELAIRVPEGTQVNFTDEPSALIEVDYLSGGFMAIHRRVFEKLLETHAEELPLCHGRDMAFYPFFRDRILPRPDGDNWFLSEDWAFVERAREAGFKAYLDQSVRLGHIGNYTYTFEDMVRPERISPRGIRYTKNTANEVLIQGQILPGEEVGGKPVARDEEIVVTRAGFKMHIIPGDMMISDDIRRYGVWDKEVHDAIIEHVKPGMTFLDLGAHFGYFSLLAAHIGANVIAVEPNPEMMKLLTKSAKLNSLKIDVAPCAISNWRGEGYLVTTGLQNNGESYIVTSNVVDADPSWPKITVRVLSELLGDTLPEVIKVDIEGEDGNVIAANPDYFKAAKVVIFEVSLKQLQRNGEMTVAMLMATLESYGFVLRELARHDTYADWIAIRP